MLLSRVEQEYVRQQLELDDKWYQNSWYEESDLKKAEQDYSWLSQRHSLREYMLVKVTDEDPLDDVIPF